MGGELALHRETQRTSPRKLPCGEGKTEAGSVHSLVSSRRRRGKRASADSRSSLHGPFLPSDDTEGTVPVSRRSTRGSLISRMSRCHWSLGRVRSAPAWLLSRPLRPGCSLLDCWTPRGPALEKAVEGGGAAFPRDSRMETPLRPCLPGSRSPTGGDGDF